MRSSSYAGGDAPPGCDGSCGSSSLPPP
jgi:hypothetical protein